MGTAKTGKRPPQQPAQPKYAHYWAPLTRKRHILPHPAQPRHTNHWAPRTRKRHQQEHRPQRPTERSDPTQHAKGRPGDCPGPRKETTTQRNVTQGGGGGAHRALCRDVRKIGYFGPVFPNGQGNAVSIVFPYAGLLRFLLSPKAQILSQHTLYFPLKVPDRCLNLLFLPCGRRWWAVSRVVAGNLSHNWALWARCAQRGSIRRGARAVRVLGLFRRPFHPEPIRGNGNASEPSRYHLQLLSP